MTANERRLLVAGFLDEAVFADVPREAARGLVERFLAAAEEDFGAPLEKLDGEALRELVAVSLPRRLGPDDPLAAHADAVLDAFLLHLQTVRLFPGLFEARQALQEALPRFHATVSAGSEAHRASRPDDPFVHGAPRLGRNDPCSCGSGKKYKKCHGRGT